MKVKGIMALIVSVAMIMGAMPLNMGGINFKSLRAEAAEAGTFNVEGNSIGYSYIGDVLTISSGGEYTISMAEGSSATSDRIRITARDNNVTIILDNVNISTGSGAPLEIATTSKDVTVKLSGKNYLKATGPYYAGLQKSSESNKLVITNADEDEEGSLEATGYYFGAGIGGGSEGTGSNITISGGIVTATGGYGATGIGGGYSGNTSNITITGGNVTATGGYGAAGIGGGSNGSGSSITISGGEVNATGDYGAAGIGGGSNGGIGSSITISGGTVTAKGGFGATGIGGGSNGSGSSITISGGTVTATGGTSGAGIGGSENESGSNITISGGTVTATGGYFGAGIGGGHYGTGSNITISGGTVTATGGANGASIGGGSGGTGSNIKISPEEGSFLFARYARANPFDAYVSETDITNTVKVTTYFYSTDAPYFEEAGTETEPYLISDLTDLMIFSAYVKNTGNGALNKYFKVTNDIDMTEKFSDDTGVSWKGVGTQGDANNFNGVFDGDGHNINVYVNNTSATRQGLFGIIGSSGVVKNLSVSGSVTTSEFAGGITGINYGRIENCGSSVNITSNYNGTPDAAAGGIVGSNAGRVINCYSTGSIKNVNGIGGTGGIVGRVREEGTATNCYYLEGTASGGINGADVTRSAEAKTADEFASGEVTYLLNGSVNSENSVWKQTLGEDKYPEFDGLNVVGFTKNSGDTTKLYANEVTDGISITTPVNGTFKVTVDTSKFGGESAKYLEAVNVVVNDEKAESVKYYEYDETEQFAEFEVSYTGSQDYEIRAEVEAKESGTAEKIMYYVTGIVTAPAYAGDETEATSLDLNAE